MGAATRLPIAFALFTFAIAGCALAGCVTRPGIGYLGGWDKNVSERTELWGGYVPDAVYRIDHPLFLLDLPERTNGLALVPGLEVDLPPGTVRGPTTIEDYESAPRQWRKIKGVVEPGTRVRAFMLRAKGNLRDPGKTRHYVKGRILNGPFQGTVVDLEPVSLYREDPDTGRTVLVGPNNALLTQVT